MIFISIYLGNQIFVKLQHSIHLIPIPITIKENLLTYSGMFSEQTAPIGTYDIPIDSDLHGEGPWKIWAPGIDRVLSSSHIDDYFIILGSLL